MREDPGAATPFPPSPGRDWQRTGPREPRGPVGGGTGVIGSVAAAGGACEEEAGGAAWGAGGGSASRGLRTGERDVGVSAKPGALREPLVAGRGRRTGDPEALRGCGERSAAGSGPGCSSRELRR